MQKIPSLFVRDYEKIIHNVDPETSTSWGKGTVARKGRFLATHQVTPGCEWVVNGEGIPFRKWDGTACMIKDGWFYKRYDAKNGKTPPSDFIPCQEPDINTGHWPGWVLVGPHDKWIDEAIYNTKSDNPNSLFDGTYEAVGPKINGNNDGHTAHKLIRHTFLRWDEVPVTFDDLNQWFIDNKIEGIVWHHGSADGRMCKIKRSDFGLKWPVK